VIGAEIDQAGVGRNVIDAIGSDLAECGNLEVMNAYGLRIAFGPQLTTTILEIADQFLLFGIDRDGRLVAITELFDLRIDVFKLHVTVRMGRTLPRFLVGMKAEAELPQQPANQLVLSQIIRLQDYGTGLEDLRGVPMFKGRHFDRSVILLCVRWYLAYNLSLRDLEEMMAERGLSVDHSTVHRWVVRFSPELLRRFHQRKRAVAG